MDGENASGPIAFGTRPRLLGMLTLPGRDAVVDRGVVMCAPLGHEDIRTYRPLRALAEQIADRGLPVLRFDWPGCGDSEDLDEAPVDATPWLDAASEAIEVLRRRTGVADVAIVGLRFGATLGLIESLRNPAVSSVALLAPIASGRAYLRELRALQALAEGYFSEPFASPPQLPEGSIESSGFFVPAAEARALATVEPEIAEPSAAGPARALIATAQPDRAVAAIGERLRATGCAVTSRLAADLTCLWDATDRAYLPPGCRNLVCDWLLADAPAPGPRVGRIEPQVELSLEHASLREQAAMIDTDRGRMFGLTCARSGEAGSDWVVFLNAGRVRRVGANRFWTTWARRWASSGVPSLRLDVHGVGDSDGERIEDETKVGDPIARAYRPQLVLDIRDALDWLADRHEGRRFALVALCSGATLGYQAALHDERVAGVAMVNAPALFWDDRLLQVKAWDEARTVARSPQRWDRFVRRSSQPWLRNALRGGVLVRPGGRLVARQKREILGSLAQLGVSGTRVSAIFSEGDIGLRYLERHLGPDFRQVLEGAGVTVEVVRGPDHTFRPLWSHEVLRALVEDLLASIGFLARSAEDPALLADEPWRRAARDPDPSPRRYLEVS